MSARWHLCGASRQVVKSCTAPDLHAARLILNPRDDLQQFVISDASYAVGFAKPLPSDRCVSCGMRPKLERYDYCKPCEARRRGDREAKARRKAGPGDKRLEPRSEALRAKIAASMKRVHRLKKAGKYRSFTQQGA